MKVIKLATSIVNQSPLDWEGNSRRLREAIAEAKAQGASILCLPELSITGYGCEDQFLAESTCTQALQKLEALLPESKGLVLAVGLPLRHHHAVYNTVALIADGQLLGFYAKQNLAGDGIHYEPRWFRPWPVGVKTTVKVLGGEYPLGDVVFDVGGVRIGFEVCEDAWVAERPGRRYARLGVDLILNPSASHFAFRKQEVRERFVCEGSRAFGVAYAYANLVGNESGRVIYDGGGMIASAGRLLTHTPRFSFAEFRVATAAVDLELNRLAQASNVSRKVDAICELMVEAAFDWPQGVVPDAQGDAPRQWSKEEEFSHAVALGLFDYLRKSHSRGYVVSLSGGADSAAVVCLIKIMRDLALGELGEEGWLKRFTGLKVVPSMADLLLCVYQATSSSGEVTARAAAKLAATLGADYQHWDVQPAVDHYRKLAEQATGRALDWETDDIALQNIQARVRAPGVWMMANLRQSILLATSNRSEAAVGYSTMDGDTCGGLSPIAGIDKAFLRQWLAWLETTGAIDIKPVPELEVINVQKPTAELRPADAEQTDEDDLMPYPVLDAVERMAIRDKKAPADVLSLLKARFPGYQHAQLRAWVVRFFRLWSRNQWKRERYAPSFHLDDENLDPKTWCRFPILSGGFEEELAALEESSA